MPLSTHSEQTHSRTSIPTAYALPRSTPVYVAGIGIEYPQNYITAAELESFVASHFPDTPALRDTVAFARNPRAPAFRAVLDKAVTYQYPPPSLKTIAAFIREHAVPLAVKACQKALAEAKLAIEDVTHLVASTVADGSSPGVDATLALSLGLGDSVQRALLAGKGCAGGLASLRVGTAIALATRSTNQLPVVLCVAIEAPGILLSSELEQVVLSGKPDFSFHMYGDGASAIVLSCPGAPLAAGVARSSAFPDIGESPTINVERFAPAQDSPYVVKGLATHTVKHTLEYVSFNLHERGWHSSFSREMFNLAGVAMRPLFTSLMDAVGLRLRPDQVDWAFATSNVPLLEAAAKELGLEVKEHLKAGHDLLMNRGSCSSATSFVVMQMARGSKAAKGILVGDPAVISEGRDDGDEVMREYVVAVVVGPGITIEMILLQRCKTAGIHGLPLARL